MSYTAIGGIRPLGEERKLEQGFWNAAVPSTCVVPLQQHVGSRLTPLVEQGDVVREGMIIADGTGRLAVPVHAPIPGRVTAIGATRLLDDTISPAIRIQLDGEFDRLGKQLEPQPWTDMDQDSLRAVVRSGGIVAGARSPVPAHVFLQAGRASSIPIIVLDLAETEPYLTADAELTASCPREISEGIRIAAVMVGAQKLHVVASANNRHALAALRPNLDRSVRVHRVAHRYPVNLESQFRRAVLSRSEQRLSAVRLVPISPSTAFALYEAVVLNKPQIDRVIAVGGGAVRRPAHIRVRIGTSVADVLAECGGLTVVPDRIITGGPLTGSTVTNVDAPITKSTTAVLALTEAEIRSGSEQPCVGCGACARACPVDINPALIRDLLVANRQDDARVAGILDCIECGLCAHVCPSRIPLVGHIREGKARLGRES